MEPVKRVRVVDSVAERILSAVANGDLSSGERLPAERELASSLQVSRNVLREAVRQLEIMGILSVRQGDGTYVNDLSAGSLVSKAMEFVVFDNTTFIDLIEARQAIEVKAAALAAERATPEEVASLQAIVDEMADLIVAPKEYAARDLDFHLAIVRASRNKVLMKLFSTVQDVLRVQLDRALEIEGVSEHSQHYHRQIAASIAQRNSVMAGAVMDEHLASITPRFLEELARRASSAVSGAATADGIGGEPPESPT